MRIDKKSIKTQILCLPYSAIDSMNNNNNNKHHGEFTRREYNSTHDTVFCIASFSQSGLAAGCSSPVIKCQDMGPESYRPTKLKLYIYCALFSANGLNLISQYILTQSGKSKSRINESQKYFSNRNKFEIIRASLS